MVRRWIRNPAPLAMVLMAAMAGCSDQAADKDTAVLVPDPSAPLETGPKPGPAAKAAPKTLPEAAAKPGPAAKAAPAAVNP